MPTEKKISKYYQKEYFIFNEKSKVRGYTSYKDQERFLVPYFLEKLKQIKSIIKTKRKVRLLDVGCALGFFLEIAKEEGWDVIGLDISDYAVEELKKRGIKGFSGELSEANFKRNTFDIVTTFQTIEHEPNPLGFLKEMRKILRTRGVLFLTTPNRYSLFERLFGKSWHGWSVEGHLLWFDKKNLEQVLKKAEFTKFRVEKDILIWSSLFDISEAFDYFYPNWFTKNAFRFVRILPGPIRNLGIIPQIPSRSLTVFAVK